MTTKCITNPQEDCICDFLTCERQINIQKMRKQKPKDKKAFKKIYKKY